MADAVTEDRLERLETHLAQLQDAVLALIDESRYQRNRFSIPRGKVTWLKHPPKG
jgi:hypothetical protein